MGIILNIYPFKNFHLFLTVARILNVLISKTITRLGVKTFSQILMPSHYQTKGIEKNRLALKYGTLPEIS